MSPDLSGSPRVVVLHVPDELHESLVLLAGAAFALDKARWNNDLAAIRSYPSREILEQYETVIACFVTRPADCALRLVAGAVDFPEVASPHVPQSCSDLILDQWEEHDRDVLPRLPQGEDDSRWVGALMLMCSSCGGAQLPGEAVINSLDSSGVL